MWLSALFLVKEENAHGDLSEGETVKVTARTTVQLLHPRVLLFQHPHAIPALVISPPYFSPSIPLLLCRAGNR